MSIYNWENSAKRGHKKVKKTGTVVFHVDDGVPTSFDRLLKEQVVQHVGGYSTPEDDVRKIVDDEKGEKGYRTALLTPETKSRLTDVMKFTELLPCQAQVYRGVFHGRDIVLHSRTGSGKTLAFALPIIERHILFSDSETHSDEAEGPFLIIFLFSNELAVQTKSVLTKIYPKLKIAIAGTDTVGAKGKNVDVLIGMVRTIDEAIRGKKISSAETAAEESEKKERERLLQRMDTKKGKKRLREKDEPRETNDDEEKDEEKGDSAGDDELAEQSDEDGEAEGSAHYVKSGDVSASRVRAIVIDEVDCTLGPRFTNVGRRMKNLLKYIRKANGSLSAGLKTDFRAHHYVLCGATIPNWVLKAGFLGVKKYYYQLVTVGTEKLPRSLDCYSAYCPFDKRIETAKNILLQNKKSTGKIDIGRVVVFGSRNQIDRLETEILKACEGNGKGASTTKKSSVSSLSAKKSESERILAMNDFNSRKSNILICTDLAARGLDFFEVDTVLMLSLPNHNMCSETFVHRAGRTARVHRSGKCIVLYDEKENQAIEMISKTTHVVFKNFTLPTLAAEGEQKGSEKAKVKGDNTEKMRFTLTVKSPFRGAPRPGIKVPSAKEVLEKQLDSELYSLVSDLECVNGGTEVVKFQFPSDEAHQLKQKLWKYDLVEVHNL